MVTPICDLQVGGAAMSQQSGSADMQQKIGEHSA